MTGVGIIGAGVAGLTCATELVERGVSVTIYDGRDEIGPGSCSWHAGGMLAPYCEREAAEEDVITLGASSADWWQRHTGMVVQHGTLVVAAGRDRTELTRFAARTREYDEIDGDKISELEPDLAGRFQRGLFFSSEAHLNPREAIVKLADNLRAKGVMFRLGEALNGHDVPGDLVIDARGFAARDVLEELRGVRGEMLIIRCPDISLKRPVRLLHPRIPLYIVPRDDSHFMVGATMIESAERKAITARSLLEMLGAAYALHPAFGEAEVVETGVDIRPAFSDNLPRMTLNGRVVHINGLYRHGFLLGPAMAVRAADMVQQELLQEGAVA